MHSASGGIAVRSKCFRGVGPRLIRHSGPSRTQNRSVGAPHPECEMGQWIASWRRSRARRTERQPRPARCRPLDTTRPSTAGASLPGCPRPDPLRPFEAPPGEYEAGLLERVRSRPPRTSRAPAVAAAASLPASSRSPGPRTSRAPAVTARPGSCPSRRAARPVRETGLRSRLFPNWKSRALSELRRDRIASATRVC